MIFSSREIRERTRDRQDPEPVARMGVNVITERDGFVHVSGHPDQEELMEMYQWIGLRFWCRYMANCATFRNRRGADSAR